MSKHVLKYFMWPYQSHFRWEMEYRAKKVLERLGVDIPLQALLVGVRVPEITDDHPVCFDPEDREWNIGVFAECHRRTEDTYKDHPEHGMFYSDEATTRDQPENIRRDSARLAVREALHAYDGGHGTRSFCGDAVRVGSYHVVPVLQLSREALDRYPSLPGPMTHQRWSSSLGIVHAVVEELLIDATEALAMSEPGRFVNPLEGDATGTLRRGAQRLCQAPALSLGDAMHRRVFDVLNEISSLRYEGGDSVGEIVFAKPDSPLLKERVDFVEAVPMHSGKLARKIVEMSGDGLACVCDTKTGLTGLARVELSDSAPTFRAVFTGHYHWELRYNDALLMRCAFGVPSLPSPRLAEADFGSNVRRAEAEARRLRRQSIQVEPTTLTPSLVRRVSGIDGAIIVDRDCRCHAVGVILDGLASDEGDPARGARFNSAVRYVNTSTSGTVCIVMSEDGYVDMIPTLRPQVSRDEVRARVDELRSRTKDNYHETRSWLDDHRFYLSAKQCDSINEQLDRIFAEPWEGNEIRIVEERLSPHPDMDESYYSENS
jgi:hypothetical protein